jgi:hypothetical protein
MSHEYNIEGKIQLNKILENLPEYNERLEIALEWKSVGRPLNGETLDEYVEVIEEAYQQAVSVVKEIDDSVENYTELDRAEKYLNKLDPEFDE